MARRAAHARTGPASKRPGDLVPGDVVVLDGAAFEVVSEPFLGMAGSSVFDAPELFWRARVQPAGGARHDARKYATWPADGHVTVYPPRRA